MVEDKRCVLAYTSMYIEPDGKIRPCCVSSDFEEELNFNDYKTIPELYNSPQMRGLRKSMEDGTPSKVCDICYKGNNGLMPYWNERWKHKLNDPNLSDSKYNVKSLDYLDARFSNICNFKCRMCGPGLSSQWDEDHIAVEGQSGADYLANRVMIHSDPVGKFTAKDLQTIEHMNVGGGEPFITADFWKLIDSFTDEQKSEITMYVNTNGSVVKYKGESIMEKLSKFKEVVIGVSCDGFGAIGEYQRTGMNQKRFDKNFTHMLEYAFGKDNLIISMEYTITSMNLFHIQDFIFHVKDKWPALGYGIHFHWATTPYYFAPVLAPNKLKQQFISYIEGVLINPREDGVLTDFIHEGEEYQKQHEYSSPIDESLNAFLNHLNSADVEAIRNMQINKNAMPVRKFMKIIDERRGEDWKVVVPHMEAIINADFNLI